MLATILNSFRVAEIRKKLLFTAAMLGALPARAPTSPCRASTRRRRRAAVQLRRVEHPRLPQPVHGRRAVPDRDLRARDHAVHHGLDHPAAADGGLAVAGEAAEGGRGRPAADHAVHALPDRRPRGRPGRSATSSCSARRATRPARRCSTNFNAGTVVLVIVVCLTAGCVLLMWLGELITQRGIGNGISLMIFASIVSRLPHGIQAWWTNPDQVFKVIMPFLALGVIAAIVFIQEGQRRIPVQYAKRVIGRRMSSGGQTYLPLRVNMAGVIPVIFAASIMAFPPTLGQLVPGAARPLDLLQPRTAGPTSSARPSSSSSSRTSTRRSPSTRSTRRTTCASTAGSSPG